MNYFTWFDLPQKYFIDSKELKKKFLEKSRLLHPDFHSSVNADLKKQIETDSATNNTAYRQLNNDTGRLLHLFSLFEIAEKPNQLPPDFLMEMMDLNETLESLTDPDEIRKIQERVNEILQETESLIQSQMKTFDTTEDAEIQKKILESVLPEGMKLKYLNRMLAKE